MKTKCQTSGAQFHTQIQDKKVSISVDLPFDIDLNASQSDLLEKNIHNAMELVLSPIFQKMEIENRLEKSDKFSDAELKKIVREAFISAL